MNTEIRAVALVAFAGYFLWNIFWLCHGQAPPSVFGYCTGLPCPTTGMTRSLVCLYHGNFSGCLLYNPFAVVYLLLTVISAGIVLVRRLEGADIVIPSILAKLWLLTLILGWVAKFALGNKYW